MNTEMPLSVGSAVPSERRTRRSEDPLVALHHHLAETRRRTSATAVVLADMQGVVVAGAGAWPLCEELAAYAPILVGEDVSAREARFADVALAPFEFEGNVLVLAVRGGANNDETRTFDGIRRILAA